MKTRVSAFLARLALPFAAAVPLAAAPTGDLLPLLAAAGAGGGDPGKQVRLGRAMALVSEYVGSPRAAASLERDAARPLSLAAADLDGDGVPELVAGYAGPAGGILTVRRGNIDAIYPNEPEAQRRRAEGTFTDSPFHSQALVFELPEAPDFLAAGDFDNDGRTDLLAAASGGRALHLLAGDGLGGLAAVRSVPVTGAMNALAAGDFDRADGLPDLAVGVTNGPAAKLLVFEGSEGALQAEPEVLDLPTAASALAMGRLDGDYLVDLAVAAGRELLIFGGIDRTAAKRASRAVERRAFPSAPVSLAVGNFTAGRSTEIAVLLEDGMLHLLARRGAPEPAGTVPVEASGRRTVTLRSGKTLQFDGGVLDAPEGETARWMTEARPSDGPPRWEEVDAGLLPARAVAFPRRLVAARVTGGPAEDLLVLDRARSGLSMLRARRDASDPETRAALSVESSIASLELLSLDLDEGAPVDLLPMRLNRDALADLVLLPESGGPSMRLSEAEATFVVTSAANGGDCNTGDGVCKTDSGGSCTGPCTLRAALQQANASGGADTITFAIGAGPVTIAPTSLLPIITSPVTIDGTTQPGYAGSPIVEIDGTSAGAGNNGITVDAGPSTIRGLVVNKFGFRGIELRSSGNIVEGNYVGTNIAGTAAKPNAMDGILVFDAPSNTIGGLTAAARNVASGNGAVGIQIFGAASVANFVQGNYAGTNAAGTGPLANAQNGIVVNAAAGNTVGGTTAAARNVISGNLLDGLIISGPTASANLVQGNYVGTNAAGSAAIPNAQNAGGGGMRIVAPSNTIGGTAAGAGNLVSGNFEDGIEIPRPDMTGNLVQGNLVGTDATGTLPIGNEIAGILVPLTPGATIGGTSASARNVVSGNTLGIVLFAEASNILVQGNYVGTKANGTEALPNASDGILVQDAPNNTIGGTTGVTPAGACTGACNLVSGNGGAGVYFFDETDPGAPTGNVVKGNRIGTDKNGTADLGNALAGVVLDSAADNTIGGTTAAERNVISGNDGPGVLIGGGGATGNTVTGNYIGTKVDGTTALANGVGVFLTQGAADNAIGGTAAGAGNTIAGNTGAGVVVDPTDSGSGIAMHNPIRRNKIFSNGALGIDLGGGGVTANDDKDPDAGPNNLQNYPVISSFTLGTTAVGGTLNSTPNTTFQLDFYTSAVPDPSGNGEGGTFQISTAVTTNAAGNAAFNVALPAAPPPTHVVTATATSPAGDTSEFSCAAPCRTKDLIVNTTDDDADPNVADDFCDADLAEPGNQCTLRAAIQTANARAGTDTITFDIPGGGTKTIAVTGSALPTITQPVILDATTQPGYADTPLVVLDGTGAGAAADGLKITAGGSTVKGFIIIKFGKNGILLQGAGGNTIQANILGTNAAGAAGLGNGEDGLSIDGSPNNTIGGAPGPRPPGASGQRSATAQGFLSSIGNVLAGNLRGLRIAGTTSVGNQILGNLSGVFQQLDGTLKKIANLAEGIKLESAGQTTIGAVGAGNIVSGNGGAGILASLSKQLKVIATKVGTDDLGSTGLGNGGAGIVLDGTKESEIGGLNDGEQNVVAANVLQGISLISKTGALADLNKILATYVGTDATGKAGLGNGGNGIALTSAIRTIIDRTVTAGNTGCGVQAELKLAEAIAQMNALSAKTVEILNSTAGVARQIIGNIGGRPGGLDPAQARAAGLLGGLGGITKKLANTVGGACFDQIFKVALGGLGPNFANIFAGNGGPGILAKLSKQIQVMGSFIGTDEAGGTGFGNTGDGIQLDRTSESTIGDLNDGGQNVVAANTGSGIAVLSASGALADLNKIFATYVGTDATGKAGLGNLINGIKLTSATRTVIDRTVTAGNTGCGVQAELKLAEAIAQMNALSAKTVEILNSTAGVARQIIGNIGGRPGGLDPAQARAAGLLGGLGGITKKLANTVGGACFDQMFKALLGGTGPLGNILGGNGGPGILAKLSKQIELKGSFIGTDETGAPGFANTGDGVRLEDSEQNIFDSNTLSGNDQFGMRMLGLLSKLNVMQRNLVGMISRLSDGLLQPLPNLQGGILLDSAPDNDIGLPVAARGLEGGAAAAVGFNVISGNTGPGVTVTGANAIRNALQSNFIGTNEAGTGVFGNSSHGVFLTAGARMTVVGGPGAGTGNVIAFNGGSGVSLDATAGDGNVVDPNAIYGNAGLGIDLNNDGIRTPNDPGDADEGPNRLQNYPEIVSARLELNGDLVVQYKVDSAPANSNYGATGLLVEFFQSDPGQQGRKFLGNDRYTAAEFGAGSPGVAQARLVNARGLGITGYDSVVGSATDNDNNTSEFSEGVPVVVSVGINDVKITEGNSGTTDAIFRVSLAAKDDEEITVDYVTANGSASAPGDYTSASGVLTFPPDTTVQTLAVQVKGDGSNEANETFVVNLTGAIGAVIGDSQGVATVLNDDGALTNTIAPTSGPSSGGTGVTLAGANYVSGATVSIGGAVATGVAVSSSTEIEATTPALPPGTLNDVVVTNPDTFTGTLVNGWLSDFLDMPQPHIFHDFVETLFRNAVTAGCGGGNFCPNASVTRAQMAVFLLKAKHGSGYAPPAATGTAFTDVPLGSFAAEWIEQLAEEGITAGCGGGKYCPNNPVTRAQMAVFLLKAKHGSGYVPPPATGVFSDVLIASPFAPWIEQLAEEGITAGCGGGKYCPNNPNTRGQMAVFLVKTFALP